jgi:hypothetical protein
MVCVKPGRGLLARDVLDDTVERIMNFVAAKGDRVVVVDDGLLADRGQIAGLLRIVDRSEDCVLRFDSGLSNIVHQRSRHRSDPSAPRQDDRPEREGLHSAAGIPDRQAIAVHP